MEATNRSPSRQRDNTRKRLKATAGRLEAFAADLERALSDRSGNAYWSHRLLGGLLCEAHTQRRLGGPNLKDQVDRIVADAGSGCALSKKWLDQYHPLYALCIHLQQETPPKRADDYDPLEELSDYQKQLLQHPAALAALLGKTPKR